MGKSFSDTGSKTSAFEMRIFSWVAATFIVVAISGFGTYFYPGDVSYWQQWSYLYHTLLGYVFVVLLIGFVASHFRRTIGTRRPVMVLAGIIVFVIVSIASYSGLQIGINGQTERLRYVYDLHVVSSAITTVLLLIHVVSHRLFYPRNRPNRPPFLQVQSTTKWLSAIQVFLYFVVVISAGYIYSFYTPAYSDMAAIQPYEQSYGPHPFRPSQTETSTGGFFDERRLNVSRECEVCHKQIFDEWKASIHSQAASDRAYQTNINLLAKNKGMAATRYCEGCHVPVALVSGQLSKGGRLDTYGHMYEGVGCLGCHGIDQVLNTNGVASYRMSLPTPYLFSGSEVPLAKKLTNFLIQLQPSQHRADMARAPLPTPEMCATCHSQFMDKEINGWGWVKMQDDYSAWLNSPMSKQSEHTFAQGKMQRCQDCHFPLEKGEDPSANGNGEIVSHRSLGANTAIPHINGDYEQVNKVREFLQANRIRVSIDKPTRTGAVRSQRFIDLKSANVSETPGYYYLGERVNLNVVVSNLGVGHDFPGGTTDINEVWLHILVTDSQDRVVFESGKIDAHGNVDEHAFFYRSLPVDRQGDPVWRHDLFRMVGDSYKKVVEAGSSDVVSYDFMIPSWVKGSLAMSATVRYRKLNNQYAKWALAPFNGELPITDVAATSIKVPVRVRAEAGR